MNDAADPEIPVLPYRSEPMGRDEYLEKRERLQFLSIELSRRKIHLEPLHYGAPDLLFPQGFKPGALDQSTGKIVREPLEQPETLEQYHARQAQAIYDLVTEKLLLVKDEKIIRIRLTPQMAKLLADLFYERIGRLILWANRGGGKSLLAAIFMWITFVYRKKSCLNMAGAGNQAKRVYDYTKQFWQSFPGMLQGMLDRDPLLGLTEMKGGSKLICATSHTTAIGEHVPVFTSDEACSDRPGADEDIMRAMQGSLTESGCQVFLLSTFHLPTGLFANIWDNAEDMGFTRAKWDCFESMEKCTVGLETATPDDPKARDSYCRTQCPLTWKRDVLDPFGNVKGQEWVGCDGKARDSEGWYSREQVLEEQKINKGTRVFEVEHACIRPQGEGRIYNKELIDACVVDTFGLRMDKTKIVGVDWGLTQCAVCLVGEWEDEQLDEDGLPMEGLGLIDIVFMSNRLVDAVVDQIRRWQERYGDNVIIRADGSHPYCNKELQMHGYHVRPVFGDRKLLGEDNMARWIGSGRFKILTGFTLLMAQLHNLRRNLETGKQKKENLEGEEGDHGPDSLKFALCQISYLKWVAQRKERREALLQPQPAEVKRRIAPRRGLDGLLS